MGKPESTTLFEMKAEDIQELLALEEVLTLANNEYGLGIKPQLIRQTAQTALENAKRKNERSSRGFFPNRILNENKISMDIETPEESIGSEAGIWGYRFSVNGDDPKAVWNKIHRNLLGIKFRHNFDIEQFFYENKASTNFDFKDRLKPENIGAWLEIVAKNQLIFTSERTKIEYDLFKELSESSGASALPFSHFHERLTPQYSKFWEEILEKRKLRLPKPRDIKEWDVKLDGANRIKRAEIADELGVKDFEYFNVRNVKRHELDQSRNFTSMSKEQNIAEILIIEDDSGNVEEIEVWFPHYTMNEDEGWHFVNQLTKDLDLKERTDPATEILRKRKRKRKSKQKSNEGEKNYTMYDISTDYDESEEESDLISLARKSITPALNTTLLYTEGWLGFSKEKSAYICVQPDIPLQNHKTPSSELQLALIPYVEDFEVLNKLIEFLQDTTLSGSKSSSETKAKEFIKSLSAEQIENLLTPMLKLNAYTQKEIIRARKGKSLVAVLDTYLPEILQEIMARAFVQESDLVTKGGFQISSVRHNSRREDANPRFTTALNLTTKAALGIINFFDGKSINLRLRTGEEFNDEISRIIAENKGNPNNETQRDLVAKDLIRKTALQYRKYMVSLSTVILLLSSLSGNATFSNNSFESIVRKGKLAIDKINSEIS